MSTPLLSDKDAFWERSSKRCGVITSVYQLTVQGPWFYKFKWLSLMEPEKPYLFKKEHSTVASAIDGAIERNQYVVMKDASPELMKLLKILFTNWTDDV